MSSSLPTRNRSTTAHPIVSRSRFVSVIVPVFNGGRFLARCLTAIRQSSCSSYELIVVDNGSTDDSVAIAQTHADVVLHCPGPSGPGAARNVGARHAAGDILFFVDADVVIHPDAVARVAGRFAEQQDLAALFGSYDDNPDAQNFLSQYKNLLHHFVHQHANSNATTFWAGCGAVRNTIFHEAGGFDQAKYPHPSIEDIELGFRLHRLGYRIVLDKHLQGQHLKEWRLGSLLRADILYRAIPWSQLIVEQQGLLNDLNLKITQRVSAGTAGISGTLLALSFWQPSLMYGVLPFLALFLFLNRDLFAFFFRRRSVWFAARAIPLHMLYLLYSSATFVLVWCLHPAVTKRVRGRK